MPPTTSASPRASVAPAFDRCARRSGTATAPSVFKTFGTAQVKKHDLELEFVGARKESYQHDSRNPIVEDGTLEEDQNRRDFTINAMAYNERVGLVDIFGGQEDIKNKLIRAVGNPDERFAEDALRIMRAVRFAGQLGYDIEEKTFAAGKGAAGTLKNISAERIQIELIKLMKSDNPQLIRTAYEMGITKVIMPEFDIMMQTEQNTPHHMYTVGEHTINAICNIKVPADLFLVSIIISLFTIYIQP